MHSAFANKQQQAESQLVFGRISAFVNTRTRLFCMRRDRDELASQVSILKVRLEEMKHREQDAYLQVKSSIEMVEQSQLDMAQVGV